MSRVRLEKELEKRMKKRSKTSNSNDNGKQTWLLLTWNNFTSTKAEKEVLSNEFFHGAIWKQP